ncbi:hypothetical protein LJC61_02765 [Ruminococcaceae bacterium OttesenSCG-928-A16]|nr:hypothetical protein [Ruminococcaceae bacterium OttesenSCG-928-A16]
MNTLEKVKNALMPLCDNVGHYTAARKGFPRIVWEEVTAEGLRAENITDGQAWSGVINLFSKKEFEPLFDSIQNALNQAQISFYLNSVQYEEDTGVTHWEWAFSVV